MVIDVDEEFYFKPDAGRILASPADETPVPPSDVQPEELDVAVAVDRVERATVLQVRRIASKWAGLRTFAPDKTPVVGMDSRWRGLSLAGGAGRLWHQDFARARPGGGGPGGRRRHSQRHRGRAKRPGPGPLSELSPAV